MAEIRDEVIDTQDISAAIRKELDRHLIDANDANTFADYRERAGFNKGLREAGNILSRCFSRGDFALSRETELRRQIADELTANIDRYKTPWAQIASIQANVIDKLRGSK